MDEKFAPKKPFFTKEEWQKTHRVMRASGRRDPNALRFKANSKDRPKWLGR